MKGWHLKRIDDLGTVVTGKTPSSDYPDEFGVEYPFVTPSDIPNTQKHITVERYLSEKGMESHKRIKLPTKTTCVVCIGATIGKTCMTHSLSFSNQQINSIIANHKNDSDFIYYMATTLKDSLVAFAGGAATPIVNKSTFSSIKVLVPEKIVQRKIAAVLSAYADLIENNNHRIALLEKMAEELYREWFVRLRFPGHEKVKIVKGVPEGWEVVELNKIAKEASKSTKPGTHLENRCYLPIDLLQQRHFNPESHQGYAVAQSSLVTFQKSDLLFGAMRPYLHKVCIAPFDGITRTTCFVMRPLNEIFYSYLYLLLFQNSTVEYATLICNGADRPYVVWNKAFERMPVFKPSEEIVHLFEKLVRPMISKISGSYFYLQTLKDSRDRLLSRLMSGKIDLENLDIRFPASMKEEEVTAHA